MYRLKPNVENFQMIDGPFDGRQYQHGIQYQAEEIPESELHRFEQIPDGGEEA